jgi:hypothetical protein
VLIVQVSPQTPTDVADGTVGVYPLLLHILACYHDTHKAGTRPPFDRRLTTV